MKNDYPINCILFIVVVYYCSSTLQKYILFWIPARILQKKMKKRLLFLEFCNVDFAKIGCIVIKNDVYGSLWI